MKPMTPTQILNVLNQYAKLGWLIQYQPNTELWVITGKFDGFAAGRNVENTVEDALEKQAQWSLRRENDSAPLKIGDRVNIIGAVTTNGTIIAIDNTNTYPYQVKYENSKWPFAAHRVGIFRKDELQKL